MPPVSEETRKLGYILTRIEAGNFSDYEVVIFLQAFTGETANMSAQRMSNTVKAVHVGREFLLDERDELG